MSRKYATLFCLCILNMNTCFAQQRWSAGLNAGYTHNEFYTNISNYQYNYYRPGSGFTVGLPVKYAVTNWLALQAEPGFIQKSFALWFSKSQFNESSHLTSRYSYVQLPLMAQLGITSGKWQGFINIGAYASYWLSGHIKGTQPDQYNDSVNYAAGTFFFKQQNVNASYQFNTVRDRRLQFGWLAGVGVTYALNKKLALTVEARYYQDITDQQKKYMRGQMPRYNYTGALRAGALINFSALHNHQ